MIELFTADTPNGKKISIMLEEIKFDYKVTKVDLGKGEQFNPNFRKILHVILYFFSVSYIDMLTF